MAKRTVTNKIIDHVVQVGIDNLPSYREVARQLVVSPNMVRVVIAKLTAEKVATDVATLISSGRISEVTWKDEREDGLTVTAKYRAEDDKTDEFVSNLHDSDTLNHEGDIDA